MRARKTAECPIVLRDCFGMMGVVSCLFLLCGGFGLSRLAPGYWETGSKISEVPLNMVRFS